jgi:DNA-binding PadR family transcriptional regulator
MGKPGLRGIHTSQVTPAEFHILLALVDRDLHGYAVMQQVSADSAGTIRLGPGTLYTAIKRLLDYGYLREVESRVDPALDDSRRKYYRVTTSGRAAARAEAGRLEALVKVARARQLMDAPTKIRRQLS